MDRSPTAVSIKTEWVLPSLRVLLHTKEVLEYHFEASQVVSPILILSLRTKKAEPKKVIEFAAKFVGWLLTLVIAGRVYDSEFVRDATDMPDVTVN